MLILASFLGRYKTFYTNFLIKYENTTSSNRLSLPTYVFITQESIKNFIFRGNILYTYTYNKFVI